MNPARHIYENIESEVIVNIDTIMQEIDGDKLGRNMDEDKINPYHEVITNKIEKEDVITM